MVAAIACESSPPPAPGPSAAPDGSPEPATPVPTATSAGLSLPALPILGAQPASAGTWYLYVIDGDLWESDGRQPAQLTQQGNLVDPSLGPSALAYVERSANASDLWLATSEGPPRQVTQDASPVVGQNHWASQPVLLASSPRAYVLSDHDKQATGVGDLAVWELDLSTGQLVQITHPPAYGGGDQDVTVNPSASRQIVFTRYAYDPAGQLLEQLDWLDVMAGALVPLTPADHRARQAQFAPDGTHLAFVQTDGQEENLYVGTLDASGGSPSLAHVALLAHGQIAQPAWSPDGTAIAYAAVTGGAFQLWSLPIRFDADGTPIAGQPRQVTNGPGIDATSRPVVLSEATARDVRQWVASLASP